jgi:hypothetical protein
MAYEPDYYAILHLDFTCSQEEIRDQFKRMVKVFHPDRHHGDPWCDQQLRICNKAYEVLGDPESRLAYDKRLSGISDEPIFDFGTKSSADSDESAGSDQTSFWTFEAAPEPERPIDASQLFINIQSDQRPPLVMKINTETFGASKPHNTENGASWATSTRTTRILVGLGIMALIAVGGLVGSIGNQTVKHLSLAPPSTQFNPLSDSVNPEAKAPVTIPAVQTNLDASASAVKATEQKTRLQVAPYWRRYQGDESKASRVLNEAEREVDPAHQVALDTESQMLQETSTEIQDQFDDLSYGADAGTEKQATARLTSKLDDYEAETAQIQALSDPSSPSKADAAQADDPDNSASSIAAPTPQLSLSDPAKLQSQ